MIWSWAELLMNNATPSRQESEHRRRWIIPASRDCEERRDEAIQRHAQEELDCFVATAPRNDDWRSRDRVAPVELAELGVGRLVAPRGDGGHCSIPCAKLCRHRDLGRYRLRQHA